MKKFNIILTISALLFILLSCGKEKKEEKVEEKIQSEHQWTDNNKMEFERNCVGFLENEGVENAKMYCDCLLNSSIESYPDPKVAMDLEQNEIVTLFVESDCVDDLLLIKIEDPWTDEVGQLFIDHCLKAQEENGIAKNESEVYCSCALEEIKQIVPNPHHVMTLTEDELSGILAKCKP